MESKFQFKKPNLAEIVFKENDQYISQENMKIKMPIQLSTKIDREGENLAKVSLRVKIGEESEKYPYFLCAIEESEFRWSEEILEDQVTLLLNQNAPALLLSYLRPVIAMVTSNTTFNQVDLPFMDFTKRDLS